MALSKKLKNALKSSPATKPLVAYLEGLDSTVSSNNSTLQNAVDNDTIYDDTNVWTAIGVSKDTDFTDNYTDLSTLISGKADSSALNSKANANHNHTLDKITDTTTVEAVVTYEDNSTETILLVKKTVSNES